jgi:hypothetical protein
MGKSELRQFKSCVLKPLLVGLLCILGCFTTLAMDSKWETVSTLGNSKFEINKINGKKKSFFIDFLKNKFFIF